MRAPWLTAKRALLGVGAVALALAAYPTRSDAAALPNQYVAAAGYELLQTIPGNPLNGTGTFFGGVPVKGVPVSSAQLGQGTWNFGTLARPNVKEVGMTDTIIQRLADAHTTVGLPMRTTITAVVDVMQLVTETRVNSFVIGGVRKIVPNDFYFITLQSARGKGPNAPPSTGPMSVGFVPKNPKLGPNGGSDGGQFSSTITYKLDIHQGSLNGKIVFSDTIPVSTLAYNGGPLIPWGRNPPTVPPQVLVPGINFGLSSPIPHVGSVDFWPGYGVPKSHNTVFFTFNQASPRNPRTHTRDFFDVLRTAQTPFVPSATVSFAQVK